MQLGSFHQGQQSVLREHQPAHAAFCRTPGRCRTLHRQATQNVATPLRTAIIPVLGPSCREAIYKVIVLCVSRWLINCDICFNSCSQSLGDGLKYYIMTAGTQEEAQTT